MSLPLEDLLDQVRLAAWPGGPRAVVARQVLAAAAMAGSGTARLLVSATVVRSVQVSVRAGAADSAALHVSTSGGVSWSASVDAAAAATGIGLSPSAVDPSYVIVTVLADGPPPEREAAAPSPRS